MSKLKPCPFCGAEGESFVSVKKYSEYAYAVKCYECGGKTGLCEHEDEAIQAWNQRDDNAELY